MKMLGQGFIIGIRASTMWGRWRSKWGVGEAVSQKPVQPVTQVDGEREGRGGVWGAVPLCSSPLCGFTARYLVVDSGSRWSIGSAPQTHEMQSGGVRMCCNLPASLHLRSPHLIMVTSGEQWLLFHFCFQSSCEFLLVIFVQSLSCV